MADALGLLRSRVFLIFLLAGGAGAGRARGVLHLRHAALARPGPLDAEWAGALWAISDRGEVALFAYSGAVVRRIGAGRS